MSFTPTNYATGIDAVVRARLAEAWVNGASPLTLIVYQDEKLVPAPNKEWLKVSILHGSAFPATLGQVGLDFNTGVLQFDVYVPLGTNRQAGATTTVQARRNELAGIARSAFNRYFNAGLVCGAVDAPQYAIEDAWAVARLRCTFTAQQFTN